MLRASKKALSTGDGNLLTLTTAKTSFCDSRKVDVQFRWNKHGKLADDAYEARFEWALASAQFLANPTNGVGDLRAICNVSVSADRHLVTCPQLNLRSVEPEEFEAALMSNQELLDKLYTFHKIEKLRPLSDGYAEHLATLKAKTKDKKNDDNEEEAEAEETPKPKSKSRPSRSRSKAKDKADEAAPTDAVPLMDLVQQAQEEGDDAE
jgi:hypothetical protein